MAYKSFKNTINKLRELWANSENNTIEIKNVLERLNARFQSINFSKKIVSIPIIDEDFTDALEQLYTVNLNNFPEWLINYINIVPIVEPIGDVTTDTVYSDPFEVADAGQLKVGDISFTNDSKYWIAKLDQNNYILKIFVEINVREVISVDEPSQGNFNTQALPYNLNLSLKIINPRIYELTNIQKV